MQDYLLLIFWECCLRNVYVQLRLRTLLVVYITQYFLKAGRVFLLFFETSLKIEVALLLSYYLNTLNSLHTKIKIIVAEDFNLASLTF